MGAVLRAIPLPLRIAALLVLALAVYGVIGAASAPIFLLLACVLWLLVICIWMYELGWLNALARVPVLSRFLGFMSNRKAVSGPLEAGDAGGPRGALEEKERDAIYMAGQQALADLRGHDDAIELVHQRIVEPAAADPKNPFGSRAPAAIVFVAGPRGVGKTTAAKALARMLVGVSAVKTANIVTLKPVDLRSGSYGSVTQLAQEKARSACDGILFLDDADWLIEADPHSAGTGAGLEFGDALLEEIRAMPGRITILATLGAQTLERLSIDDGHKRWLGKLARRDVILKHLDPEDLLAVMEKELREMGWELEDDATATAARRLIDDMQARAGDAFDNADACRRLAERLVQIAQDETRGESSAARVIGRETIRTADDMME